MPETAVPEAKAPEAPVTLQGLQNSLRELYTDGLAKIDAKMERAMDQEKQVLAARGGRLTALEQKAAGLEQGQQDVAAAVPQPQPQPETPNIKLRPFGEVSPGDSTMQALQKNLMTLGLIAQMGMGVAKGHPQGALAAYTGALQGWAQGDRARAETEWQEYLAQVQKAQREWQHRVTAFEAIRRKHEGDIEQFRLQMILEAGRAGMEDRFLESINKSPDNAMKLLGLQGRMLGDLLQSAIQLDSQRQMMDFRHQMQKDAQAFQERMRQDQQVFEMQMEDKRHGNRMEEAEEKLAMKPLRPPAGGMIYDTKGKQALSEIPQNQMSGDPTRYKVLNAAQRNQVEFIDTTPPMLRQVAELIPQILTDYPGYNIAQAKLLALQGKLGMTPALRNYLSINRELTVEATRILGGGGQLRVSLMNKLENEVSPRVSDTQRTAQAALNTMAINFENRKRTTLGLQPLELSDAIGGTWVATDGRERKGVRLKPGEILTESLGTNWKVVEPLIEEKK